MIGDILTPSHLLFILVVALLVLGPKRLPEVGRALGRGLRDFRNAINTDELRDQIIAPTGTTGPPVEQPPADVAAPPVEQPVHRPATKPDVSSSASPAPDLGSSAPSTDDNASSSAEASQSPEATAAAPTPERVP